MHLSMCVVDVHTKFELALTPSCHTMPSSIAIVLFHPEKKMTFKDTIVTWPEMVRFASFDRHKKARRELYKTACGGHQGAWSTFLALFS